MCQNKRNCLKRAVLATFLTFCLNMFKYVIPTRMAEFVVKRGGQIDFEMHLKISVTGVGLTRLVKPSHSSSYN